MKKKIGIVGLVMCIFSILCVSSSYFALEEQCTITVSAKEGGEIKISSSENEEDLSIENESISKEYSIGSRLTLTAIPREGKELECFVINGEEFQSTDSTLELEVVDSAEISVFFHDTTPKKELPSEWLGQQVGEGVFVDGRLRSTVGADCYITQGATHAYGSWFTKEFYIDTDSGSFTGYCTQPSRPSPVGTFKISELTDESMRAVLFYAPGGPAFFQDFWDTYGFNPATGGSDGHNDAYSLVHACLGVLYAGETHGLSSTDVAEIRAYIDMAVDNARQDYRFAGWHCYIAINTSQDIAWGEYSEVPRTGKLKVRKLSANEAVSSGNPNYSLEGAQFGVYTNGDCTGEVGRLTTNADGYTKSLELDEGTYYVAELKEPKGFYWSDAVIEVNVVAGADNEVTVDFTNTPMQGKAKVRKTSDCPQVSENNSLYSLAGGVFGIYSDSGCTQEVARVTTDASGYSNEVDLPLGDYWVKELQAPEGFALTVNNRPSEVKQITIAADQTSEVSFSDVPLNDPFDILVYKTDSKTGSEAQGDGKLAGTKFQLDYFDSLTVTKEQIQSGAVRPKHSYIFQTVGFPLAANGIEYKVNVNDPRCYVSSPTNSELLRMNGAVTFPLGTITVREVEAGEGYHIEDMVFVDKGSGNAESTDNFVLRRISTGGQSLPIESIQAPGSVNEIDRGSIVVMKRDAETKKSEPQGQGTLEQAVFEVTNVSAADIEWRGKIYKPNQVVSDIFTEYDANYEGYVAKIEDLPYGSYKIKEVSPPEGYLLAGSYEQIVKITEHGQVVELVSESKAVQNFPIRGGVTIQKRDDETGLAEGREDIKLEGAVFQIISNNPNPVRVEGKDYTNGQVVKELTTGEDGKVSTANNLLPYGSYTIKEVKAPEGFLLTGVTQRTFSIREHEKIVSMESPDGAIRNTPIRGDLELLKLKGQAADDENDHREGLEGAEFTITSKRTGEVQLTIVTDEHGVATTKGKGNARGTLLYGTYIITETFTPEGFKTIKPFEVKIREEGVTVRFIYLEDKLIMAPIQVLKVDSSTGNTIPIADTTFKVLDSNKEPLTLVQHYPQTVKYTEFKTDESGSFTLPEKLQYGTYYLEEIKSPYGYLKGELLKFEVDEGKDWDDPIVVKYADDNVMGKVRINKTDASTGEVLAGATFNVVALEDIITPDGTLRNTKDEVVDVITTNEEGKAESKELFLGKYYVQEVEVPDGFMLDDTKHNFELEYVDQDTPLVYADFDISNKPTEFFLKKQDIDGKDLKGIKFNLTHDSEKPRELTTDENGEIELKYVKRGKYTLEEVKTLPGYILDKTPRYFLVSAKGTIYETTADGTPLEGANLETNRLELSWINDYTKVDFSKTDVTGDVEVEGATLRIEDKEGNIIEEWVSGKQEHRIDKLPMGDYVLKEYLTPDEFVKANDIEFTVTETGEVQKVHMIDKQVFVTKTDITGEDEVEGANLKVVDKEGNTIDEWVSTKEPHPVTGLEVGKTYILIEEQAPDGYVLAEKIEFTVDDDNKIQHVEMKDLQVFINKSNLLDSDKDLEKPTVPESDEGISKEDEELGSDNEKDASTAGRGAALKSKTAKSDNEKESTKKKDTISSGKEETATFEYPIKIGKYVEIQNKPFDVSITEAVGDAVGDMIEDIIPTPEEDTPVVNNGKFSTDEILEGRTYLKGAVLQVVDEEGNVVDEWTTDGNTYAVSGLEWGKTYTLIEKEAPEGYVKSIPYQFTVDSADANMFILMKDKQVILYKKDIAGEELPGAEITITDEEGNIVDEWVSTTEPHPINGLEENKTYTFKEVSAPDGYLKVEEFDFTVDDSLTNLHIKVTDNHTRVSISKQDATTGTELPGAKLTLFDWNNNVVETWTSEKEPHLIERLIPGTYRLHEDLAPIGYNTSSDVTFEVKPTEEVQKVVMKDEVKPKVKKLVQTGEIGLTLLIGLFLFAFSIRSILKRKGIN